MNIITISSNASGAYPPIHSWNDSALPEGYAVWPDTVDTANFYNYNGFVTLTVETVDDVPTVTSYTPNVEAWETWKASLPPDPEPVTPEPTDTEVLNTLLGVTE